MKKLLILATIVLGTATAFAQEQQVKHVGPIAQQIERALNAENILKVSNFKGKRTFKLTALGCQTPAQSDNSAEAFCSVHIPSLYTLTGKEEILLLQGEAAEPLARLLQIVGSRSDWQDGNLYRDASLVEVVIYGNKYKDKTNVTTKLEM